MFHFGVYRSKRACSGGFSLAELAIVIAISFVVLGIALPSFMQMYRGYQLTDAASRVAAVLKATRLDAIRRNNLINCRINGTTGSATIWDDSNGDGIAQSTESQTIVSGALSLASAGAVANPAALAAAVGVGTLTVLSPADLTTLAFDFRGAPNPAAVYVLYIRNTDVPAAGFRAVILLPSGAVQMWSASNGQWNQYS